MKMDLVCEVGERVGGALVTCHKGGTPTLSLSLGGLNTLDLSHVMGWQHCNV